MAEAEETECVISTEILCMIAEEVGPKWMVLARLLGVKENIIDNIAVDVQDVSEKAYQSMRAWIQSMQNASDRLAVLLDVLERMGRNDIVAAISRRTRATELSLRLAVDCRLRLGQIITFLAPDALRYLVSTFDMPRGQSFDWWIYQKLCEEEARLTSPPYETVRLKKYYKDVLYPWRDGKPPTSDCEIWYKLTGNLDVEVWRYLIMQLDLIKQWHPAVHDVYNFRKNLFRLGPRKLSNKECEDLWKWLREIFAKLGLDLGGVISNYDLSGSTHKERGVADNFWFRLAAVVQYHLPCAALQLFMRKVVLVDPAEEKGECMEKLPAMLERNKGEFIGKLSQWEKDIIYPQATVVNAADFSIVIWRKLVQHFCPHELVRQLQTVPTVRDIEEYFSEGSGPGSQVEGLYQFQNLILNMGCKEMEEKEFDMLWECLERILTVLKYDLKKISEFRSSDFGFDFPKGATKESPERSGQDERVADNYWFRLSAVVHYHFPYAALQLFKSSVYMDKPVMEEEEFIQQLKVTLSEQKELLVGKLSKWEKDIVYPTSAAINTGDFSIGVWRKLVQHYFPGERVLKLKSVPKISDVEKYFSEGTGPSSLVEGLYQFRNFLICMGSRKMGYEEFNVLWECLERILTVLKYDVAKISEYKTADFDLSCPESLTKKPREVLPRKEEETVYKASDQDRSSSIYESAAAEGEETGGTDKGEVVTRKDEESVYSASDQDLSTSIHEDAAVKGEKALSPDSKEGEETGGTNKEEVEAGVVEDKHKGLLFAGVMLLVLIAVLYGTSEVFTHVRFSWLLQFLVALLIAGISYCLGRLNNLSGRSCFLFSQCYKT